MRPYFPFVSLPGWLPGFDQTVQIHKRVFDRFGMVHFVHTVYEVGQILFVEGLENRARGRIFIRGVAFEQAGKKSKFFVQFRHPVNKANSADRRSRSRFPTCRTEPAD